MKTKLVILLSIFYCTSISFNLLNAQTCLPDGINFSTQSQIDDFVLNYPDCSKVLGGVIIHGGITNLYGLNSIEVIGGHLSIAGTDNLHDLDGLESLDSIGTILNDYDFFGGLHIGGQGRGQVAPNDSLINIDGLSDLSYVGGSVWVGCNPILENLDGLENLTSIGEDLTIISGGGVNWYSNWFPSVLEDIEGLSNLNSINGVVRIEHLDSLTSLHGLQNIDPQGISGVTIYDNQNLSYCEIASICNHLLYGGLNDIDSNATGCNSEEEVLLACATIDVSEINPKKTFSIYPNPNIGLVNIDLSSIADVSIKVLNLSGQLVYSKENINSPLFQFDLDAAPGVYILEISSEGEKQSFKLIKQ